MRNRELLMREEDTSIIVIDDEDMVRINLADFLEDEGYLVAKAASGEEGLQLVKGTKFDIAIVDMRLPGIDGNTFILEAHRLQPELRYLIHTGSADYSLPEDLRSIGISQDLVFYKPVHDMELIKNSIFLMLKG